MDEKIQKILDNEVEFTILRRHESKGIAVLEVDFPNCPPPVRRKILVYKGNVPPENAERILPHFGHESSPCARFNPDQNGWDRAIKFATLLINGG